MQTKPASPDVHAPGRPEGADSRVSLQRHIRLQLVALGFENQDEAGETTDTRLDRNLLANYRQKTRLLKDYPCAADAAIEEFLGKLCRENNLPDDLRLPRDIFNLSSPGLARELSLPVKGATFENAWLKSYRVSNGVLHNPRSDRQIGRASCRERV